MANIYNDGNPNNNPKPKKKNIWTDGNPNNNPKPRRRGGKPGRGRRNRPRLNPLDLQVSSAINQQVLPYMQAVNASGRQFDAERNLVNAIEGGLQSELKGISSGLEIGAGDLLNIAAQRNTSAGETAQRNMDFLKNVLGSSVGDFTQVAQEGDLAQAQSQVANVGNTTGLALGAQSAQRDLANIRGTAALQRGEDINMARRGNTERQAAFKNRIAQIQSSRPLLSRQFQRENLEDSIARQNAALARQQLALQRDQFGETVRSNNMDYDLGLQGIAAQGGSPGRGKDRSRYGLGLSGEKWDGTLDAVLGPWTEFSNSDTNADEPGIQRPGSRDQYTQAYGSLIQVGLPPAKAAQLAVRWTGVKNLKNEGMSRVLETIGGLDKKSKNVVMTQIFGKNWRKEMANALRDAYQNAPG